MKKYFYILFTFLFVYTLNISAQLVKLNGNEAGMSVNVLRSTMESTILEFSFEGYNQKDINVNGTNCISLEVKDMVWLMEKGLPQLPISRKSIVISDRGGINYKIITQEMTEKSSKLIMPSKGHFTRDINPSTIPYTFDKFYNSDKWYPEKVVELSEPYIIRDLRGLTIQFNPMQFNSNKKTLRICTKLVIEIFYDASKQEINPLYKQMPLLKVSSEFAPIYRDLFVNYGKDNILYDSIPEPGRLLVIYASQYASYIAPFVSWKLQKGMTVLTAEYPTQTGSGNTAIKTYIQNLYNQTEKITYIVLIGESDQIPTNSGLYESAPSDPCYVKLLGNDAYPDAFISRISVQNPASLQYVLRKIIKYESEIQIGAPWYHKATGVASNEGSPPDWQRANWLRDTLMLHGFTFVDQIYDPGATKQMVTNALNDGRSVLNYIGHGSGTSWGTTGYGNSDIYTLTNGWKNPFILDVACLNGNFTMGECMEEAWLRAGDTLNPKGAVGVYGSSTNASWVPPCDMQTHSMYLFANGRRNSIGGVCFLGLMYAMDLWGGSQGEGLKLMEQYNIFGDCSTQMTLGVTFGPAIVHTPLTNTENMAGPYAVNCLINPVGSPIDPAKTRLFWTRTTAFDSLLLTNTSGNNWTANIPGNGNPSLYKYFIKTADMMNRVVTSPGGAPSNYYSFLAMSDTSKPVIVHTAIGNTPKNQWPVAVNALVTDMIGIDSVWVRWYKNNVSTGIKHFKLNNTGGNNFSGLFNSDTSQVAYNDIIYYKLFGRDNSSAHNCDSTSLYNFTLIAVANACIGNGSTAVSYPYNTYWHDSKTDMLYTSAEIIAGGGTAGMITRIGFNVVSAASQTMNGFNIKMQNTTMTSLTGFVQSGWTTVYSGTYTVPGTGWQYVDLQTPFAYTGTQNLLVEICFDNTSYTSATTVNATSVSGMTWTQYQDNSAGCGFTAGSSQASRPNLCMTISLLVANQNIQSNIPKVYSLEQNYPNPFNPSTSIKYSIPKQSMVKLVIYDIIGREVATLVNEVKTAGNYSVAFDGTNLASGVYFYRIEAGTFTNVKKMILVK